MQKIIGMRCFYSYFSTRYIISNHKGFFFTWSTTTINFFLRSTTRSKSLSSYQRVIRSVGMTRYNPFFYSKHVQNHEIEYISAIPFACIGAKLINSYPTKNKQKNIRKRKKESTHRLVNISISNGFICNGCFSDKLSKCVCVYKRVCSYFLYSRFSLVSSCSWNPRLLFLPFASLVVRTPDCISPSHIGLNIISSCLRLCLLMHSQRSPESSLHPNSSPSSRGRQAITVLIVGDSLMCSAHVPLHLLCVS